MAKVFGNHPTLTPTGPLTLQTTSFCWTASWQNIASCSLSPIRNWEVNEKFVVRSSSSSNNSGNTMVPKARLLAASETDLVDLYTFSADSEVETWPKRSLAFCDKPNSRSFKMILPATCISRLSGFDMLRIDASSKETSAPSRKYRCAIFGANNKTIMMVTATSVQRIEST
jgi:hypothetical protein